MDLNKYTVESITRVNFRGVVMDVYCDEACVSAAVVGNEQAIMERLNNFPDTWDVTESRIVEWVLGMKSPKVTGVELFGAQGKSAWVYSRY